MQSVMSTGASDAEQYLPARKVRQRYDVSAMSIHRWLHDAKLNFPRPIYIGKLRYWRLSDLCEWERSRAGGGEP